MRSLFAACVLCVGPTALGQSAPTAADSMLVAAERMISSCFAYAAANKLPPLSVVVVDAIPGGIPFARAAEAVAGAVAVSGARPDQDAACAMSAIGAAKASS